jgi:hypothetical protein
MNLRKLILVSLFLAIGFLLHQIIPGLPFGNMKPDPFLAMMFISILLCDDYKMTLVIGLASGILTAMTTTFPGGQIPNVIDKVITSQIVFLMVRLFKNRLKDNIKMSIISIVGTFISGTVFLASAFALFGLPAPFGVLILGVVIPAAVSNTIMVSLY